MQESESQFIPSEEAPRKEIIKRPEEEIAEVVAASKKRREKKPVDESIEARAKELESAVNLIRHQKETGPEIYAKSIKRLETKVADLFKKMVELQGEKEYGALVESLSDKEIDTVVDAIGRYDVFKNLSDEELKHVIMKIRPGSKAEQLVHELVSAKEEAPEQADQRMEDILKKSLATEIASEEQVEELSDEELEAMKVSEAEEQVEELSDEELEAMKAPEVVTAEHQLKVVTATPKKGFKAAMKAGEADVAQQKLAAKGEAMSARAELTQEAATAKTEETFFAKGEAMDEKAQRAQEKAARGGFFARFFRKPKMETGAETMRRVEYEPSGRRAETMEPEGLKTPPRVAYPERPTAEEEEERKSA